MNVQISRRASRQVDVIHDYLRRERPSAASDFLDAFYELRSRLNAYPRSSPVIKSPDTHQATVAGFPYVAVYRVTKGGVIILAVFHTSHDPSMRSRP